MYKLPEDVLDSTVYTGWKIAVGWPNIRKYLEKMHTEGYTIVNTNYCYSNPDYSFTVVCTFMKAGELVKFNSTWGDNGMESSLKYNTPIENLEKSNEAI